LQYLAELLLTQTQLLLISAESLLEHHGLGPCIEVFLDWLTCWWILTHQLTSKTSKWTPSHFVSLLDNKFKVVGWTSGR